MLLAILKPTYLALASFSGMIGTVGAGIWFFFTIVLRGLLFWVSVVALVWLAKGRPPLADFIATIPFIPARLRPSQKDQESRAYPMESRDEPGQPKPLLSAWTFFRSSSPLDDLLVTFTLTRHLTRPLWQTSSSTAREAIFEEQEKVQDVLEAGKLHDDLGAEKSKQ
jgi:hypothetical protein